MKIPQHIAIILDGNGRWAKAKKAVKDTDTDYLVVPKAKDVKGALEKERYLFVGETPNYYIYSVE